MPRYVQVSALSMSNQDVLDALLLLYQAHWEPELFRDDDRSIRLQPRMARLLVVAIRDGIEAESQRKLHALCRLITEMTRRPSSSSSRMTQQS